MLNDANELEVTSTSERSATGQDIVLDEILVREGEKIRLAFRPEIVDNIHDPTASVRGTFLYQKKGKNESWEDYKTLDLNRLKKGEYIKLHLRAGELKKLIDALDKHYKIFEKYGIRPGTVQYIFGKQEIIQLVEYLESNSDTLNDFFISGGLNILPKFIEWLSQSNDATTVIKRLQEIAVTDLEKVSNLIGIANIKKVLEIWEKNKKNSDEEFWQKTFLENSWLISQLFAVPMIIFEDKAYVGGKSIADKHGQIVDFIYKNSLTSNIAIVEIKTPVVKLVATSSYRANVYAVTENVSGGIAQVLSQKHSLLREYNSLKNNDQEEFNTCNPRCILIVGCFENTPLNKHQLQSFELFRNTISGIEVITFDELFKKAELLVALLEGSFTSFL